MESIQIGLQLTAFGMGIVFLLLALMATLINLLLRLDRPPAEPATAPASEPSLELPAGLDADMLAAIAIAVRTHRAVRRKQAAPAMRRFQPGTLPSRWVAIGRTRQNTSWRTHRRS